MASTRDEIRYRLELDIRMSIGAKVSQNPPSDADGPFMKKGIAILLAGAAAVTGAFAASAAATPTCNLVASPAGSDSASGTSAQPFATAQKLVSSLQPGQTGCLRAGSYQEDVTMRHGGTANAPLVVRSFPGEAATIVGRLRLAQGADYTTISDLTLVGLEHGHECSKMCASPTVDATHTTFIRDDVTNNHADAICFLLGDVGGVWGTADYTTIQGSRIHDCGALPATNYDHGIYVEETHGSQILDNLIYGNADRGIQLYPQAIATVVRGNVIAGNGEGVDFGAMGQQSSNDNLVENNIISGSNVLYNVLSAYEPGDQVGTGNVVRKNCIGGGAYDNRANPGGVRFDHTGFKLDGNTLATPIFSGAGRGDFSLAPNSPCAGILGSGAPGGGGPVGRGPGGGALAGGESAGGASAGGGPGFAAHAHPVHRPPGRRVNRTAHTASVRVTIRARWGKVAGHRVVRIDGRLSHHAAKLRAVPARCQAARLVILRVVRRRGSATLGWGRTQADCTFTAAAPVDGPREVRLEAVVVGVGRSNIVTVNVARGTQAHQS